MRNHGTDPGRRFGVMRERVEAVKEIWTSEEASYHGKHVDFERIWSWPKPVQTPHPPVLVGGNGKTVYDRVVAFGDAWIPNYLGDVERLAGRMNTLQAKAAEAGRGAIPVTIWGVPRNPAAYARLGGSRDHPLPLLPAGQGLRLARRGGGPARQVHGRDGRVRSCGLIARAARCPSRDRGGSGRPTRGSLGRPSCAPSPCGCRGSGARAGCARRSPFLRRPRT